MIDIESESLLPLSDVPKWCEQHIGKRVHPSTVTRWRLRGARGVKLSTILCGGTRYTSLEAIYRFFYRTTEASQKRPKQHVGTNKKKLVHAVKAMLDEGILPTDASNTGETING